MRDHTVPWRGYLALTVLAHAMALCQVAPPPSPTCARVVIEGEVSAGSEWSSSLGEGWVFRVLPIAPSKPEYSGWDLVVDREPPAGFPDALLLATMPYNSINEREIGTTFGLRAQDALGWNPRSFRFLTDPVDFREAQQAFKALMNTGALNPTPAQPPDPTSPGLRAMTRLLALQKRASSGEVRILDAHIVPGVSDPAPYAQSWALASSQTRQEVDAARDGKSSPLGSLNWMRFVLTLWLPRGWRAPTPLHSASVPCPN